MVPGATDGLNHHSERRTDGRRAKEAAQAPSTPAADPHPATSRPRGEERREVGGWAGGEDLKDDHSGSLRLRTEETISGKRDEGRRPRPPEKGRVFQRIRI